MNKMERDIRPDGQAELEYLDGEYRSRTTGTPPVVSIWFCRTLLTTPVLIA